jgi:hypothetical protein
VTDFSVAFQTLSAISAQIGRLPLRPAHYPELSQVPGSSATWALCPPERLTASRSACSEAEAATASNTGRPHPRGPRRAGKQAGE